MGEIPKIIFMEVKFMPTEEKSTMDLLEECERKNYEEILKLEPGDQNAQKLVNNAKTYAEVHQIHSKTEQDRLNDNARNEQAERQMEIEMEKLKNERKRARAEAWRPWLYAGFGLIGGAASYLMDPFVSKWKPFKDFQDRCGDFINRR